MDTNNNKKIIIFTIFALIVGGFIGFCFGKNKSNNMHQIPNGQTINHGEMSMADMMDSMNAALSGKSGDEFDKAFLSEMIVHHEGAVEMAKAALQNAKHQEIKVMANAIISAQTSEIAQMKNWLKAWYNQ